MPVCNDMTRHMVRGLGWAITRGVGLALVWLALMLSSPAAWAQGQVPATGATPQSANDEIDAAIAAEDAPRPPNDQKLMHWNDYVGEDFTFHFGYNFMYDIV